MRYLPSANQGLYRQASGEIDDGAAVQTPRAVEVGWGREPPVRGVSEAVTKVHSGIIFIVGRDGMDDRGEAMQALLALLRARESNYGRRGRRAVALDEGIREHGGAGEYDRTSERSRGSWREGQGKSTADRDAIDDALRAASCRDGRPPRRGGVMRANGGVMD